MQSMKALSEDDRGHFSTGTQRSCGLDTQEIHTLQICTFPHRDSCTDKKLSYRKETTRLLHNIEIRVLH